MNLKKTEKIILKDLPSWNMKTYYNEDGDLEAEGEREFNGKKIALWLCVSENGGNTVEFLANLEYDGDDIYEVVNDVNADMIGDVCVVVGAEEKEIHLLKSDYINADITEKDIIGIVVNTLLALGDEHLSKLTGIKLED